MENDPITDFTVRLAEAIGQWRTTSTTIDLVLTTTERVRRFDELVTYVAALMDSKFVEGWDQYISADVYVSVGRDGVPDDVTVFPHKRREFSLPLPPNRTFDSVFTGKLFVERALSLRDHFKSGGYVVPVGRWSRSQLLGLRKVEATKVAPYRHQA